MMIKQTKLLETLLIRVAPIIWPTMVQTLTWLYFDPP
jgi:hypothetical protein